MFFVQSFVNLVVKKKEKLILTAEVAENTEGEDTFKNCLKLSSVNLCASVALCETGSIVAAL